MTSQLGHIDMACDACGEPVPFSHAFSFVLNDTTLACMHITCYAAGVLWAAKQARGELATPQPVVVGPGKPFDGNTPPVSTAAGRKQPPPPGQS